MRLGFLFSRSLVALGLSLGVAGCGALCNTDNACATTGMPGSIQICDGSDFKSCGDSNRGQTVLCPKIAERAICSPNGWTVEPIQ